MLWKSPQTGISREKQRHGETLCSERLDELYFNRYQHEVHFLLRQLNCIWHRQILLPADKFDRDFTYYDRKIIAREQSVS